MPLFVVINHLTLDGVMQAPSRPDEDTRGGFEHGGWASSRMFGDEVIGARMAASSGLLLGHVMSSGELIQTLMRHDLIDEWHD